MPKPTARECGFALCEAPSQCRLGSLKGCKIVAVGRAKRRPRTASPYPNPTPEGVEETNPGSHIVRRVARPIAKR